MGRRWRPYLAFALRRTSSRPNRRLTALRQSPWILARSSGRPRWGFCFLLTVSCSEGMLPLGLRGGVAVRCGGLFGCHAAASEAQEERTRNQKVGSRCVHGSSSQSVQRRGSCVFCRVFNSVQNRVLLSFVIRVCPRRKPAWLTAFRPTAGLKRRPKGRV